MKKNQQVLPSYSIVKDPHMYYFLQSPQKIKDLLRTGLYKLDQDRLVEKETRKTFKLDKFVLENVK